MRKILYITAEGFDTPNPNNQMAEAMLQGFLNEGYAVHLVQSFRNGKNHRIPASLIEKANFSVDSIDQKKVEKSNFVKRYMAGVKYAFSAMKCWRKIKDVDIIYLQSNPTVIYHALLLRIFLRKTPIVYSIYDVFPGHAYDIGVIKSKFLYNILRVTQKPCYKLVSAIMVLSEDMKRKVVEQGAKAENVYVVPAWFDMRTTREVEQNENRFIKKYNIPTDKFYVQFAGTIGYVFDYKTVIELAKRLKNEEDIVFQIIGDGCVKEQFVKEAFEKGLNNIVFYPLQSVDIVSDVYSACNLCLIPLKKGVIGNGVPSKAPILMACKRMIVNSVEIDSDYARMYEENDMGISVNVGNWDELAKVIIQLYRSPEDIKRMAANAYAYGRANYSSLESVKKILNIFELYQKVD